MQVRVLSGVRVNDATVLWYDWTMQRIIVLVLALTSCYAEWDLPKVPRRDPCTKVVDDQVVYIQPTCPNPPPVRHPRDPR